MAGCLFQVVDRYTRKPRPCRIPCGADAYCRVHAPRQEVADLRVAVERLDQKVSLCEDRIAKLCEELHKQLVPRPVPPPAPPLPPPSRTTSLPLPDPVASLFGSGDGRVLASIMRSKAPFSSYTDTHKLLTEEAERIAWAVRTLKAMNAALMEIGSPLSRRNTEIRRFFCSDRVRVTTEVEADELKDWVRSLSISKSRDDLQAELRSALARRNSMS